MNCTLKRPAKTHLHVRLHTNKNTYSKKPQKLFPQTMCTAGKPSYHSTPNSRRRKQRVPVACVVEPLYNPQTGGGTEIYFSSVPPSLFHQPVIAVHNARREPIKPVDYLFPNSQACFYNIPRISWLSVWLYHNYHWNYTAKTHFQVKTYLFLLQLSTKSVPVIFNQLPPRIQPSHFFGKWLIIF